MSPDFVERLLRRLQPILIPTEPGIYQDSEGDYWRLHEDQTWEDTKGERRPADMNWMLVAAAPFYRVEGARIVD